MLLCLFSDKGEDLDLLFLADDFAEMRTFLFWLLRFFAWDDSETQ